MSPTILMNLPSKSNQVLHGNLQQLILLREPQPEIYSGISSNVTSMSTSPEYCTTTKAITTTTTDSYSTRFPVYDSSTTYSSTTSETVTPCDESSTTEMQYIAMGSTVDSNNTDGTTTFDR